MLSGFRTWVRLPPRTPTVPTSRMLEDQHLGANFSFSRAKPLVLQAQNEKHLIVLCKFRLQHQIICLLMLFQILDFQGSSLPSLVFKWFGRVGQTWALPERGKQIKALSV